MRRTTVAVGALVIALAAASGCGPSERQQFDSVAARVKTAREVPSNQPAKIIAAADDIARLEVKHPKAKAARDACSDAQHHRGRYFQLLEELEQKVKQPVAQDPTVLAEQYRNLDDLEQRLPDELEKCSNALKAILSGQ